MTTEFCRFRDFVVPLLGLSTRHTSIHEMHATQLVDSSFRAPYLPDAAGTPLCLGRMILTLRNQPGSSPFATLVSRFRHGGARYLIKPFGLFEDEENHSGKDVQFCCDLGASRIDQRISKSTRELFRHEVKWGILLLRNYGRARRLATKPITMWAGTPSLGPYASKLSDWSTAEVRWSAWLYPGGLRRKFVIRLLKLLQSGQYLLGGCHSCSDGVTPVGQQDNPKLLCGNESHVG